MAQAFKMSINKVFLYKILLLKQFVKQSKKAARLYQAKTLKAKTLKIIKFKRHYSKTLLKSTITFDLNLLPNIPPTLSLSCPRRSENEKCKSSGNQCLSEVLFGQPVEICVHFVSGGSLTVMELE